MTEILNIEEAKQILAIEDIQDAEDAFEDLLFAYKKIFLTKVPFTKLFHSKLSSLQRISEAKEFILGKEPCPPSFLNLSGHYDEDVKDTFLKFNQNQNAIKQHLSNSYCFEQVSYYVKELISNYSLYAKCWVIEELLLDEKDVKMSVEPDSMLILASINEYNNRGFTSFKDICQLEKDNLLKQEAIRLSLWSKFEGNV